MLITVTVRERQEEAELVSEDRTAVWTAMAKESFGTPLCDLPVDSLHAKIYNKKI